MSSRVVANRDKVWKVRCAVLQETGDGGDDATLTCICIKPLTRRKAIRVLSRNGVNL